ncbi:MAG: triose-phosphate isomerase [Holosporaceae bacterium]|jgi:triosephosphate isomerase|nr:triose-phosphate isomerase [Holosporaceae bacterium]
MGIVVANWKMNGSVFLAERFVHRLNEIDSVSRVVVCPPAALLGKFEKFKHFIGAQNCFYEESGAFTGESSPKLLKELGCDYVLLGHSERRALFHESDEMIYKKWSAAVGQSLRPVICIGERLEERGDWKDVICHQLKNYIGHCDLDDTIFAYEPIWSIGTGVIPSESELGAVVSFIKEKMPGSELLYGGSVNGRNAGEIMRINGIDGVLVGGASLQIDEFENIVGMVAQQSY